MTDLKDLFTMIKSLNINKIITTIKEVINIIKGQDDTMTKVMTILTKVCELF